MTIQVKQGGVIVPASAVKIKQGGQIKDVASVYVKQGSVPVRMFASLTQQVAELFASMGSTPRMWLDPSNSAARFQDQARTTPATADGQPYGGVSDLSGGGNHVGQVTSSSRPTFRTDGTLAWAQFDGLDDSWKSLASLDLSSTDKVTYVVGLRKTSDASTALAIELGSNVTANPGSFYLSAPEANSASSRYGFRMRMGADSANRGYQDATRVAPTTDVMSVAMDGASLDIATAMKVRLNGAAMINSPTANPTVTGFFGSYPLNIGRRNDASFPFSGNLYGLLIFGRALTAGELSLCERYMAQKCGVILP